ncbi:hydroxymethylbilane synthase [Actinomadura darangshiensis]|uniref:Porphobilinogen deaminase n=1 Tax=Actinomadura darangshiensis TaxID=705336 RepID=A0A4R5BRJ2_9ACTN|nr:hydroxymethylbilane synthase [Actinomadura darangshiensis]TDD89608.1 hydroxymethylbilane synthase [Actinomadura darangshiensis]
MTVRTTVRVLRMGTRKSALAMIQSTGFAESLAYRTGTDVETVGVVTEGDVNGAPITSFGGLGVFVQAVRGALLSGRVDFAVHSCKDLPTAPAEGILTAAIPAREDPRDALVTATGATFDALPAGAAIGTGSPRRTSQLLALRPDLKIVPIRGNVDTRLHKVDSGELDGVVLAAAGLDRLGLGDRAVERFAPERLLPSPAQGALAVECRSADGPVAALLARLDDAGTRAAATAERAALARLEGGCSAPVGAHAVVRDDSLELTVAVTALDGSRRLVRSHRGPAVQAVETGRTVADELLADGAAELLGGVR